MISPVILNDSQLNRFYKLWFIYGNHGRKHTRLNHTLVQGFYEHHENRIESCREGNKNLADKYGQKYADENGVTEECIVACEEILNTP